MTDWQTALDTLKQNMVNSAGALETLKTMRDEMSREIEHYLRLDNSVSIDMDAIKATIEKPYTLIPINQHEAWLIHWRGVKMPLVYGWVVAQEPAFIKAKVTRSMDLITPLPSWMKDELGWAPPEHQAIIDGTRTSLKVLSGDEGTFRKRYGANLGTKQADGSYKIKGGGAWIKLVANLIRDGILPYLPQPVEKDNWNDGATSTISLRDYQLPSVKAFLEKGAVLFNFPPGAGKTYIALYILGHFVGKVLILADTVILIEQWKKLVEKFTTNPEIVISTYQGAAKYLDKEWDLVINDECQRLPANTFSRLAFIKTKYRIGMTGTPWREDDRQFMITALSGFPQSIPWAELIGSGVLQKPRIYVAVVKDDAAKTNYVKKLLATHLGRTLIFCDWIEQGNELANTLDLPFIHGTTTDKLARLEEAERCVVSRIGDRGLDLPNLKLVIEVAFAGKSREQYAQRVGRLLHSQFSGSFYSIFTQEEEAVYRDRITGVEAETAGQIEIEYIYVDGAQEKKDKVSHISNRKTMRKLSRNSEQSLISETSETPSLTAKFKKAEAIVGARTAPYLRRAFTLCSKASFSPKEIAEGLGITDPATISRYRSACKALVKVGLFLEQSGRFTANQEELARLNTLAGMMK